METGEKYEWRKAARTVAYFDLIVQIIALIGCAMYFIIFIVATAPEFKFDGSLIGVVVFLSIVVLLAFGFGFWVIKLLMDATKKEADRDVAAKKATLWQIINVVLLILSVTGQVLQGIFLVPIIAAIIRVCLIAIVYKYAGELKGTVELLDPHTI